MTKDTITVGDKVRWGIEPGFTGAVESVDGNYARFRDQYGVLRTVAVIDLNPLPINDGSLPEGWLPDIPGSIWPAEDDGGLT